jgi:uroporphyrinogen decarboxylase
LTSPSHFSGKPFIRVMNGEALDRRPIWLMRQAGRYLPEYREIRATAPSFLDFCYAPRLAAEATLQPIRRFGFDAAILFSDILVVPDALGQTVSFETGEGPRLTPIENEADFNRLFEKIDLDHLGPVFETIDRVKSALPAETTFLGFCGAPWTVASYMIAGRGTPEQAPARMFAYQNPALFQRLIDRLVEASIDYLDRQLEAGVEAVQIFDSWAGVLPALEFECWCQKPVAAIVAGLRQRRPGARIIGFPRNATSHLAGYARATGVDMVGLDTSVAPAFVRAAVDDATPVQGNLDPLALIAGGEALDRAVRHVLETFRGRPHIFNLGHGILPQTPVEHVERLLRLVRAEA